MGDAFFCFHPEHEADLALHESLTEVRSHDKGDAFFCFHPEYEVGLSLHESLTRIDELELRHLEAALTHA